MNLKEWAKEIHDNAVKHGWWDGERNDAEVISLIHSEWSEALEEHRAGRPMVWYKCEEAPAGDELPCAPEAPTDCTYYGREFECPYHGKKPEGIAVELIDGCIRILDYIAFAGYSAIAAVGTYTINEVGDHVLQTMKRDGLTELIALLHGYTQISMDEECRNIEAAGGLLLCLGAAFWWVKQQGLDPEAIMREKHEYNKTRPWRHGGKVC